MSRLRSDSRPRRSPRAAAPSPPPEQLTVEKIAAGGSGFARRASGQPVFVRGALPGDTVLVQELTERKGYAEARSWQLVRPSSDRRTPPCRYADTCGGCDVMALSPSAQRRVKRDMVVEILRRTGHLDVGPNSATPLAWHGEDEADLGYRSRVRLHIDTHGKLGFLAPNSHEVVRIERCVVATERVNAVLAALVALSELRPELLQAFEQVEIRALGATADLTWFARATNGRGGATHDRRRARPSPSNAQLALDSTLQIITRHVAAETPGLELRCVSAADAPARWREFVQRAPLGPNTDAPALWFAPGTFTQVNWRINQRIIDDVVTTARQLGVRSFLDLYCGAGNFSLPLLAKELHGVGVENNATSIAVASAASQAQQLGGRFVASEVETAVERLATESRTFDLILLDPPRAGFREIVAKLGTLTTQHLFVCACDPVTFARDLKSLLAAGFELRRITAYDMFPQTHHVECTAWLHYTGKRTAPHPPQSETSD